MEFNFNNTTGKAKYFDLVMIPAVYATFFLKELATEVYKTTSAPYNNAPNEALINKTTNKVMLLSNSDSKILGTPENKANTYYASFKRNPVGNEYEEVTESYIEDNKERRFYNRQSVERKKIMDEDLESVGLIKFNGVLTSNTGDVIYEYSNNVNKLLKHFIKVGSITVPAGYSKFNYLYVLATQTVAHVFHVLVPRN
jgi:hypothetical protein